MAFIHEARDFEPGMLFLGIGIRDYREKGIATERHAITIAGAGSGKGAALIIPNLKRWLHSSVVIDPKGENAEQTWQDREAMGQLVGVVDPFHAADIPDRLRVSINPLSVVDPDSLTARADIQAIADGLVVRHNPQHAQWDNGAAAILAGLIAYVIGTAPPAYRTMTGVRRLLLQPDGVPESRDDAPTGLYADAMRMMEFEGCGGLCPSVGRTIITALTSTKGMERDCLGGARDHTAWIDDPAHAAVLGSSTFDLGALKTGRASLYLVIPPEYLDTQGAFLRLFVRAALNAMAKGNRTGGKCLFLLDEFFSLGKLDIVAKAAGLMRSYGVQLWPFLQDLGQLTSLYGGEGSATFFANADAQIFFGLSDAATLNHLSGRIGNMTIEDVPEPDLIKLKPIDEGELNSVWRHERNKAYGAAFANKEFLGPLRDRQIADWRHTASTMVGKPRLAPDEIASLTGKPDGKDVSTLMIVIGKLGRIHLIGLAPYFIKFEPVENTTELPPVVASPPVKSKAIARNAAAIVGLALVGIAACLAFLPQSVGVWFVLAIGGLAGDKLNKLFKGNKSESPA